MVMRTIKSEKVFMMLEGIMSSSAMSFGKYCDIMNLQSNGTCNVGSPNLGLSNGLYSKMKTNTFYTTMTFKNVTGLLFIICAPEFNSQ
jgi:hypothetical protein